MGRGLIIALGLSLAVNFLGAGYFLAYVLHERAEMPPPPPTAIAFDGPRDIAQFSRALPADAQRDFRRSFRGSIPEMRQQHRKVIRARMAMRDVLATEEWDSVAASKKFEEVRALRAEQQRIFDEALIEAFGELSYQDRQLIVEAARQRAADRRGTMPNRPHREGMRRPPRFAE